MIPSTTIASSLLSILAAASLTNAQATTTDPKLVGTWTSKSGTVLTGPDFYDPTGDLLKEPRLPGSSYSFTSDGYFEEALYIVVSNPAKPSCPTALLQWQHGQYTVYANGSLVLTPIKIDGRQILSDPCNYDQSIYTRYNQTELYKWYEILTDDVHGKQRLNLYKFDGSPANPMWLEYTPPQMLPTTTLDSSAKATQSGASETRKRSKRSLVSRETLRSVEDIDADRLWWVGVGLTGLGLLGYYCV